MAKELRCLVVTPEKALIDEAVDFVAIPMYDGELGVLPNRAPLIGRLGFGELRIHKDGKVLRYFVDGGFVQIRNNIVTLLTSRAVPAASLTRESAEETIRAAQKVAPTPEDQEAQLKAQQKARVQLRILRHVEEDRLPELLKQRPGV